MADVMTVLAATERDLVEVRKLAPELAGSALAATALALAREIDEPGNSATSKSMCARVLTDVMTQLRDALPEQREADWLDDLKSRRAARLAASSPSVAS